MNILFMMSGSIACAKASGLISDWTKKGHCVKVVCTAGAPNFIGKATLEGLSDNFVYDNVYAEGEMMQHIHLSRWAEQIIICPATAHVINKLANGLADDMLTTTWVAGLSLNKPCFIVPAMNAMMWSYPATQQSVSVLQSWGVRFFMPESGKLACGEEGAGRMLEPDSITELFFSNSGPSDEKRKAIMVTAGGTMEYIDGVRYISNMSSGRTGANIADYFTQKGYQVLWVGAQNAIQPKLACEKRYFQTFADLKTALKESLRSNKFDAVIHAAAVSDYSVGHIVIDEENQLVSRQSKLPTVDSMMVELKRNPKIISLLRDWSKNPDMTVVGFKLTRTEDNQARQLAVEKLINQDVIDLVAHNDLTEMVDGKHEFELYTSMESSKKCRDVNELCSHINRYLQRCA